MAARIRGERYARKRSQVREAREVQQQVHTSVAASVASQPLVQPPSLPEDRALIPFFIHPTHKAWYVGGFVGCERCAVINSQPYARTQLPISKVCNPESEYRPERSQGQRKQKEKFRVLRGLKEGKIPHGYKRWPDGTSREMVRQPYPLHATSFEPDARLFVPGEENSSNGS